MTPDPDIVLEARNLSLFLRQDASELKIVDDVSFRVARGEFFALIGESGSGKTTIAKAVMRLLPTARLRITGSLAVTGIDVAQAPERVMRRLRGQSMSMIFQEPMTSLNPIMKVEAQIAEALQAHQTLSAAAQRERIMQLLADVRFDNPAKVATQYPHELSGGMRQRVMIAIALANDPLLLIADEPTTALDVTIQAQILALILDLQKELGMGLVLITHDLGVVAQTAQRVIVMYAGKKVEEADVETLFAHPLHPYTRGLMASIPTVPSPGAKASARLVEIPGMVPSLTNLPKGCAFAPRCELAIQRCREEYPPLQAWGTDHLAACWRAAETARSP